MSWNETFKKMKINVSHELHNLKANTVYQLFIDGTARQKYSADIKGIIRFDCTIDKKVLKIQMLATEPTVR